MCGYGVRRLRRSPGLRLLGALTLALGIGASTAIFSAVIPRPLSAAAISGCWTA